MTFCAETYVEATSQPTMVVDPAGQIVELNPAACNLLHCRREDAIGQSWIDAFAPIERLAEFKRYFQGLVAAGTGHDPVPEIDELRTSGDTRFAVSSRTTLLRDGDGCVSGVIYAFEPDPGSADPAGDLEEFRQFCQVGRLTAGIAHDFGDVLQIIRGNVELLSLDRDDEDGRELIAAVLAAADRGADLVYRMMATLAQKPLSPDVLDVGVNVNNVLDLVRRTFPKNIQIVADVATDVSSVVANAGELESALLNVMINARDAMPDGGALTIFCRNVVIAENEAPVAVGSQAGQYVWISVVDTGHGVSPLVLPRIFDRFFTTKERSEGIGLGLASVSEFATHTGGFVNAASSQGEGLTLNIFLPAAGSGDVAATA